ncbi:MAG: hypothetical protein ACKOD2_03905 [Ilumatobacteraceae bacterium]
MSSQYATAHLLMAPYLRGGLNLDFAGERVSDSYLEMTVEVMRDFGVDATINDSARGGIVTVPEGQYVARHYDVEPDASSASYPMALVAVCGGVGDHPQSDRGFAAGRRGVRRHPGSDGLPGRAGLSLDFRPS